MALRLLNPITTKVLHLVNSGKTTKEKICVAADLKYPAFSNIFKRQKISTMVLQALLYAGVITQKDKEDYFHWCREHNVNGDGRGRHGSHKNRRARSGTNTNTSSETTEHPDEDLGNEDSA